MEFNGFCLGLLFDPAGANRLDRLAIQPNFCKQKEPGTRIASRLGMLNTGNDSGFYQLPPAIREEALVGKQRKTRIHSQKVGSAAKALGARLQASSRSKRGLLRKRRNGGVYEKSPVKDRAF